MDSVPSLNERRQHLLEIIVADYIETAAPVASQQIARKHELSVSSATIRNDMAELEEMGYITRPHTSAGGIPGDLAYRFFVERHARTARPSRQFEILVRGSLLADSGDPDEWARRAASLLSNSVRNVAIATPPQIATAKLKQLQLVHLQETQALLVMVLQDATVRQRMVNMEVALSQEELTDAAVRLNKLLSGKTTDQIKTAWDADYQPHPADDIVVVEVLKALVEEEQAHDVRQYTQGLHHILNQPEFESTHSAREAVEVLEDGVALKRVIINTGKESGIDVIIGEENPQENLRPYSVVLARYGIPGEATGVVGTVGPTRMDYTTAISSVRYLANFLSELLTALGEERP
ncbi:MAG: heat-inducible transcriptional repressor HrcA [Chloroflexi bacterium]|nr:heat-inducible transcriptional repressor HrcA [Chloroflexota bacterium]MDA1174497.1 heat-inducible transcriptional repressor HrcA [Chloroflexota bacterium]